MKPDMRWLAVMLVALTLAGAASAASIQARLIRATNEDIPDDALVKELVPKLKPVFGYEHYKLLGYQKAALQAKEKTSLDLGEGFYLVAKPKAVEGKTHTLDVELISGKASVVTLTVKVCEKKPIIIKGPEVGSTLIIVSLTVVE